MDFLQSLGVGFVRLCVRAPRASPGPGLAARRESASVVSPTADRTDHPAPRRYRRALVLRRGRQAGQQWRSASRAARGLRAPRRGLVLAGPWFTTAGSRLMVKRASRPASLIAGRRLLDNPEAAFRFISGLVIALFVASALIGALSSIAFVNSSGGGSAGKGTLAEPFCSFSMSNCPAAAQVPSVPGPVLAELHATPGVSGLAVVHQVLLVRRRTGAGRLGVVACGQLAKTPAIGKCAPGATVASIGYFLSNLLGTTRTRRRRPGRPRTCRWRMPRAFPLTRLSSPPTGLRDRSNGYGPRSNGRFPSRERRSESSRSIRRTRAFLR